MPKLDWRLLKLEPNLGKLETAYRKHVLEIDLAQTSLVFVIFNLFSLFLIRTDYGFYGFTTTFYEILALRLGLIVVSAIVLTNLKNTKSPQQAERWIALMLLMAILVTQGIHLARPRDYMGYVPVSSLVLFSIYLVSPPNPRVRLSLAVLFTVFEFINLNSKIIDIAEWRATAAALVTADLLGLFISSLLHTQRRNSFLLLQQELETNAKLHRLAMIDPLTNVKNRRIFLEQGEVEIKRSLRHGNKLTMALMDLDQFKQVNDSLGHQAGDEVLRRFARIVNKHTRGQDLFARLGGDEFGLLMPETGAEEAKEVVDRLIQLCQATDFRAAGQKVKVRMSVGLAHSQGTDSIDKLMHLADQALYDAKRAGGDHATWRHVATEN
jgi:diguanylate cyclase (GGDEF)-like protein